MREIKFRFWDKELKEMLYKNNILYNGKAIAIECNVGEPIEDTIDKPHNLIYPDWEIMQYTGLKDKNGKDIYEGDILYYSKKSKYDVVWVVIWDEERDDLPKGFTIKSTYPQHMHPEVSRLEVIGNIYKNPELLEEAKP